MVCSSSFLLVTNFALFNHVLATLCYLTALELYGFVQARCTLNILQIYSVCTCYNKICFRNVRIQCDGCIENCNMLISVSRFNFLRAPKKAPSLILFPQFVGSAFFLDLVCMPHCSFV